MLIGADYHIPVVKMYVNESCPYQYSKELIEEINNKNSLYRKAKVSKTDEDREKKPEKSGETVYFPCKIFVYK